LLSGPRRSDGSPASLSAYATACAGFMFTPARQCRSAASGPRERRAAPIHETAPAAVDLVRTPTHGHTGAAGPLGRGVEAQGTFEAAPCSVRARPKLPLRTARKARPSNAAGSGRVVPSIVRAATKCRRAITTLFSARLTRPK